MRNSACRRWLAGQAPEAIIINTSGGLAGGDRLEIDVQAASDLCLTTQAAEKVYRSLSDETRISTRLSGQGDGAVAVAAAGDHSV